MNALKLNNNYMYMCKSSKRTNNDNKLQDCTTTEGKLHVHVIYRSQFEHNHTFSFSLSRNSIAVSGSKMMEKCNQNKMVDTL